MSPKLTMSAKRQLPGELVDAVMDQIHWDEGDQYPSYAGWKSHRTAQIRCLANCSLVCKSWLPRSRLHLFEAVDLAARWKLDGFRTMEFLDLIESQYSTISPYVRCLGLVDGQPGRRDESVWLNDALHRLRTLKGLKTLRVSLGKFQDLEGRELPRLLSSFPKLKELSFAHCDFRSTSQLALALSSLPSLEHISAGPLVFYNAILSVAPEITPPSRIKTLVLHQPFKKTKFFSWLALANCTPVLHTVELDIEDTSDSQASAKLLRVLGCGLTHVTIYITSTRSEHTKAVADAFSSSVDFGYNTNLTSFSLSILTPSAVYGSHHTSLILNQVTSPQIRHLVLNVGMGSLDDLDLPSRQSISSVLQKPNFSGLESLTINRNNVYERGCGDSLAHRLLTMSRSAMAEVEA